jgi:hypothetical protein
VGILLPFELALLFSSGNSPTFVIVILLGVLLTPPFMAVFVAPTVGKSNPYVSDSYGVTPLIATRPLSSAAFIAAKLKATIWSTLAAWLLVLVAIPLALRLSGTGPVAIDRVRRITAVVGAPHAIGIGLLGLAGFMASTWKRLVQSLYIGLTGRGRLVKASVFLTLTFLVAVGPITQGVIDHPAVQAALWNGFPWILGVLICIKMSAAAWVATRLYRSRVLSDRTLVIGAAAWCVTVLALYGVLAWLFFTPFFPRYLLGLVAILAVPLARLSAAPLALAWNRHR